MRTETIETSFYPGPDFPYHLLEMADPSREKIDAYLEKGSCFLAHVNTEEVGVIVVQELSPELLEIRNLAVADAFQGKGIGKKMLRFVMQHYRNAAYTTLRVATANSSLGPLGLYQKEGFDLCELRLNFFTEQYPEPIFENGIQCRHLLVLEQEF